MATAPTQISMEEYLHTVYKPDRDYVNGELEEREVGEWDHATWQGVLVRFFGARDKKWGIFVRPELRVRVAVGSVRIPDVCIVSATAPVEQVVTVPPLATVQVPVPRALGLAATMASTSWA